ncbi:endonuclease G, mitochondrial isoform X3 [Syngnathoides biaculeatus]|uniref:endonuclease G, mitochondrial isoform X3 n=1 Tax=Syngnathoides biaculeatus TaxID=300417 RepID=UPI002ADE24EB|nr:endonuclease G, mitochondrial isoform X3 [Syngnathoides biaculeatus]
MTGRWRTTLATLSFGAALGASAGHFWRLSGGREEQPTVGLLGRLPVVPAVPVPNVHAASELTLSQPPGGAVMKYGFPSLSNIRTRESYVSSYDPRTRTPAWVIERLGGDTLGGNADRKRCDFKEDDSVHIFHRATNADYKGSGLDRGHMAAAANHKWSQKAMDDTFYLTNVAPQNPHMNQNAWNNLEKLCRSLTRHYANVYVCTGPLYLPRKQMASFTSAIKFWVGTTSPCRRTSSRSWSWSATARGLAWSCVRTFFPTSPWMTRSLWSASWFL